MNLNNNGCQQSGCGRQQCGNGKFNCTETFRAIDAACIPPASTPEPSKLAYGSFYDPSGSTKIIIPVSPPTPGQKVIFTTPGPLLNVAPAAIPNNNTDLQVATSGVYEISMDLSVDLSNSTDDPSDTYVRFGLFINDTTLVTESQFESDNSIAIANAPTGLIVFLNIDNTIGRTIQLRLNKDDRISIRVVEARVDLGFLAYNFPSLVVNKIDN
ncbi:hypothetical protein [Lysinibacillus xylanilyticus]|uniref:hypothetical protein n=1 Tax=Lysinibacillus xylanilyticus TaxID=582475 RepID=UPI00381C6894